MTTAKKAAANRRNALQSTGPRTPEGKALTSKNATRHGVLSALAVVPGLEKAADWEAHHAGVLASLAPAGPLEKLLAERVALGAWRLLRVARYEREAVAISLETVEASVAAGLAEEAGFHAEKKDHHPRALRAALREAEDELGRRTRFYASLPRRGETKPLPQDEAEEVLEALWKLTEDVDLETLPVEGLPDGETVTDFGEWTVGLFRRTLEALAAAAGTAATALMEEDLDRLRTKVQEAREEEREARGRVDRLRRSRTLPDEGVLDKVTRYESHLERSLFRTLHELQRLQAARGGGFVPPPTALDVDLAVSGADPDRFEAVEAAFEEA
jgi:hypothetical protein